MISFRPFKARPLTISLLLLACIALATGCEGKKEESGEASSQESEKKSESGHEHAEGAEHGPHDGTLAPLRGGAGFVELKLHDDKGDLEIWLASDAQITKPIDLPLDAKVKVVFLDHGDREVELAVRNVDHNEDEDGTPNIRETKTNYFIFPGDTGADASWLRGSDFISQVTVSFVRDGSAVSTSPFGLSPHHHH